MPKKDLQTTFRNRKACCQHQYHLTRSATTGRGYSEISVAKTTNQELRTTN